MTTVNTSHCWGHDIGYMEWHEISEQLHRKGFRQYLCSECGKWHWPEAEFMNEFYDTPQLCINLRRPRPYKRTKQ